MPDSLTPIALLAAWEAVATPAQVATQLPQQPAVLAWLTELATLPRLDVNVDLEDARTVLQGAGAIRAARAAATGPTRAAEALHQLRAALPPAPARHCLLSVLSSPTTSLEMDELSEIAQTLQTWLTADGEMIFGHGERPELPPGTVQVAVLLGYGEIVNRLVSPQQIPTPAPIPPVPLPGTLSPETSITSIGDALLGYSQISTALLQRRFKLGYNKTVRLMERLAAAGLIAPLPNSGKAKVLISPATAEDKWLEVVAGLGDK